MSQGVFHKTQEMALSKPFRDNVKFKVRDSASYGGVGAGPGIFGL